MNFNETIQLVEKVLRENQLTRNSDKHLIFKVLEELGFEVPYNDSQINSMPSFESITRARRKIQNDEGNYRADENIGEFRHKNQENFHIKGTNPNTMPNSWMMP